jgi:hypothetical protein
MRTSARSRRPSVKTGVAPVGSCSTRVHRAPKVTTPEGRHARSASSRSARCRSRLGPRSAFIRATSIRLSTRPNEVRSSPTRIWPPASMTRSAAPIFFRARMALLQSEMPTPTSRGSGARSKTATSIPAWRSAIAAVMPPMPPPMMIARMVPKYAAAGRPLPRSIAASHRYCGRASALHPGSLAVQAIILSFA